MNTKINSNKGFVKVDKLLRQTAKDYKLESALHRHRTMKYWAEVAVAFVEEAKEFTKAIDFQRGVLTVACLSREVASKIKLFSEKIMSALNEVLGRRVVYAIYVEV